MTISCTTECKYFYLSIFIGSRTDKELEKMIEFVSKEATTLQKRKSL